MYADFVTLEHWHVDCTYKETVLVWEAKAQAVSQSISPSLCPPRANAIYFGQYRTL